MKQGTRYAAGIKQLYNRLRRRYGKPAMAEPTDPTEQLIVAILSRGTTETRARAALAKLREAMVDFNELRVTPPGEIVEIIGDSFPQAQQKALDIVKALNDIFEREHSVNLEGLRRMARREARRYLESLAGVDLCSAASVMLFSLGGHAIPVDETVLAYLRNEQLVDPDADVAEVQGFLERHIPAADAYAFSVLLRRCAAARPSRARASAKTKRKSPAAARAGKTRKTKATRKTSTARKTGKTKRKTVSRR